MILMLWYYHSESHTVIGVLSTPPSRRISIHRGFIGTGEV